MEFWEYVLGTLIGGIFGSLIAQYGVAKYLKYKDKRDTWNCPAYKCGISASSPDPKIVNKFRQLHLDMHPDHDIDNPKVEV